jgi:hypothetical protein
LSFYGIPYQLPQPSQIGFTPVKPLGFPTFLYGETPVFPTPFPEAEAYQLPPPPPPDPPPTDPPPDEDDETDESELSILLTKSVGINITPLLE